VAGLKLLLELDERGKLCVSFSYALDMGELGAQLTALGNETHGTSVWASGDNRIWSDLKKGFHVISK